MDDQRCDRLAKALADGQSRRRLLDGLAAMAGAGLLSALGLRGGTAAQEGCPEGLVGCRGVCINPSGDPRNCGSGRCVGGRACRRQRFGSPRRHSVGGSVRRETTNGNSGGSGGDAWWLATSAVPSPITAIAVGRSSDRSTIPSPATPDA